MNNKEVDFLLYSDSRFSHTRKLATEYKNRLDAILPKEYRDELSSIKKNAVSASDQLTAKVAWCFETIGEVQDKYVEAFESDVFAKPLTASKIKDETALSVADYPVNKVIAS